MTFVNANAEGQINSMRGGFRERGGDGTFSYMYTKAVKKNIQRLLLLLLHAIYLGTDSSSAVHSSLDHPLPIPLCACYILTSPS